MSGELTPLDHVITQHGQKTVNTERLPSHLKKSKSDPPPTVEDLQREIGRLRQEIAYHEEAIRPLMRLFNDAREVYHIIHEELRTELPQEAPGSRSLSLYSAARKSELWLKHTLRHVSERLAMSEFQLLNSYGIPMNDTLAKDFRIL